MKIGFIGLGNMARAIITGIITKGNIKPEEIIGADVSEAAVKKAEEDFGISACSENGMVAESADVLILAVKPQFIKLPMWIYKIILKYHDFVLVDRYTQKETVCGLALCPTICIENPCDIEVF